MGRENHHTGDGTKSHSFTVRRFMMVVSGEVAAIEAEGVQDRQSADIPTTSSEWYFRASVEYSSLLVGSELERIFQYTANVNTHAHNLVILWMTEPFPQDLFIQEAVSIIEQSDAIEDNVTTLKNTVVRFMHTCKSGDCKTARSHRCRRRIVRRRSAPLRLENQDPKMQGGGVS
jgi:hypothetical protein